MSYKKARACFDDNVKANESCRDKDTAHCWNLNRGLHDLTVALEKDFTTLHERLERIEAMIGEKAKAKGA